MVKQKMVLKVSMEGPKRRSKALQIATRFIGVTSASLEGDRIMVVGEGVDPIAVTTALRKRMSYAELISVAPAEAKKEESKQPEAKIVQTIPLPYYNFINTPPYSYVTEDYSYDPYRIFRSS